MPPEAGIGPECGNDLWRLDAVELAGLIRRKTISSRDSVSSALQRLEQVNPAVNGVVRVLADEALAAADEADAALRQGVSGPLHGVPITVKINIDQRGQPTDNGVVAHRDLIAAEDSPVVRHCRRAGAIIIGRTNAPAYSMRWFTSNDLHGSTINPWDATRTVGGSSGGAAASVATGIGALALGNDIGGSIRYPAYCCGVVGLKPSYGRVPSYNATSAVGDAVSAQLLAVQGPLARRVRDLRLAFHVLAQEDVRDARVSQMIAIPPPPKPLRVALASSIEGASVHPAVSDAVNQVGRWLEGAGYIVEKIDPPHMRDIADLWADMTMPDVIARVQPLIEENGDAESRRSIQLWRSIWREREPANPFDAYRNRTAMQRRWQAFLETWPIVVTPVSLQPPAALGLDQIDEDRMRRLLEAQIPMLAISVLGLPAVSVPTNLHGGAPVGVQIISQRYREDLCLDVAEIVEANARLPTPIDPCAIRNPIA